MKKIIKQTWKLSTKLLFSKSSHKAVKVNTDKKHETRRNLVKIIEIVKRSTKISVLNFFFEISIKIGKTS